MTNLSREAMQLLELSPRWELRPEFRPVATNQATLTVIGLAHTASGRALWAAMARAMIDMGFPRAVIEDSVMLESAQLDRAVTALLAQRPACLLAFGETLTQELQAFHPNLLQDVRIVALASADAMVERPKTKAEIWSALHRLRADLAFCR